MLNKRGLLGLLLISLFFAMIIVGGLLYLKVRLGGLEFKTGNMVFKVNYEKPEKENIENNSINNNKELNSTNLSIEDENITLVSQNITAN